MACPRCGSTNRAPIAPGYFECRGLVIETVTIMVPDPGRPGLHRPLDQPVERPCGHRYPEGPTPSGSLQCHCQTYAIGLCATCGTAVCGDHSRLDAGVRRCDGCLRAREREQIASQRVAEARRAAVAEREAERLLPVFLDLMRRSGWPGSVPIHARREWTTHREQMRAAGARAERLTWGFDWMPGEPPSRTLRRIERSTRKLLEPDRAEVARGWLLLSQTQTDSPIVYLLTDGRQARCSYADLGIVVYASSDIASSVEEAKKISGGPLLLEIQRLALEARIPLPAPDTAEPKED
jgi:hypothetical protein